MKGTDQAIVENPYSINFNKIMIIKKIEIYYICILFINLFLMIKNI